MQTDPAARGGAQGSYRSGRGPNEARWILKGEDGKIVSGGKMTSGQMTPEMKAMGFPKGPQASHTEPKIISTAKPKPGQTLTIIGNNPPCPSCKGAMNKAAKGGVKNRLQMARWDMARRMTITPNVGDGFIDSETICYGFDDIVELPGRSFILAISRKPSDQDARLRIAGYSVSDENGWTVYDAFADASWTRTGDLQFRLTEEATRALSLPTEVRVSLKRLSDEMRAKAANIIPLIVAALGDPR